MARKYVVEVSALLSEQKEDELRREIATKIGCEPADVGRLQNALRKWLETNNKADKFVVRSTKSDHQGKGRVWLWPKGEK